MQYASRPSPLTNDTSRQISQESQMEKPSAQSIDTRSRQTSTQSASTSATISSAQTSNTSHPSASTSAGQSSQSFSNTTTTTQSDVPSKSTITNKTNLYSSSKLNQVEQMSTVFEESEPSTGSNRSPSANPVPTQRHDAREWAETTSGSSSRTASPAAAHSTFRSPSKFDQFAPPSIDTQLKHPPTKTPPPSSQHVKTINAKSVTRHNPIEYEFRVQTGNGSRLDGTNEPVIVELTDEQGHVTQIPLHHSVNNAKPFQKGQLDIFHLTLPENFQAVSCFDGRRPFSTSSFF